MPSKFARSGPANHSLPTSRAMTLSKDKESATKAACNQKWFALLFRLDTSSELHCLVLRGRTPDQMASSAIKPFASGTLNNYLPRCCIFLTFLEESNICLAHVDLECTVDFFLACQQSKLQDRDACRISSKQCQKALSWLSRVAIRPHLQALVCTPLIKAIVMDDCPKQRKEALPLPLYVVTQWEAFCNDAFCIVLGGFLLAVHASLRFGDLQHIRWSSIALSWTSLSQSTVTQLGSYNCTDG